MTPLRQFGGKIELSQETFIEECKRSGTDSETALELYREVMSTETWSNDSYIVTVNRDVIHSFGGNYKMYCLKISHQIADNRMSWGDAVLIKNQLIGEQCAMVELYPSGLQVEEGVNHHQYYGFTDPAIQFPFGIARSPEIDSSSLDDMTPGSNETVH